MWQGQFSCTTWEGLQMQPAQEIRSGLSGRVGSGGMPVWKLQSCPPHGGGSPTSTNATTVSLQPKAPSAYTTALNDKNTPKMKSTYAYQLKKKNQKASKGSSRNLTVSQQDTLPKHKLSLYIFLKCMNSSGEKILMKGLKI